MRRIMRVFLAGLLAALPLALTVAVIGWLAALIEGYAGPGSRFGQLLVSLGLGVGGATAFPYLVGLALVLAGVLILGLLLESRIGVWLWSIVERLLTRIPVVSSLYDMSKQFTALVDKRQSNDLRSMTPVWCLFGGEGGAAVLALRPTAMPVSIAGTPYVGVLIPSAPVPFGGALVYVPEAWLRPAEGGIDGLMSVYVSMGVKPPAGSPKG